MSALWQRAGGDVLGVGQFRVGAESVPYPFSLDDCERDTRSCEGVLDLLGVGPRDHVLIVSLLSEAASYWPLLRACVRRGAILSSADATPFDAARVRMFCRQLPLRAVLGVHPDTLAGLRELGAHPAQVFGSVPALAARPGAREALAEAGLAPRLWLGLGPALAVECAPGAGAHLDGALWQVEASGGELRLSSEGPRLTPLRRQPTGLRGRVETGRCACGRAGPRVWAD